VPAPAGHNAGILSEPGHPNRSYQMATRPAHGAWIEPEQWAASATQQAGSWWPAWQQWLAGHSSRPQVARAISAKTALGDAPGEYVMRHYKE